MEKNIYRVALINGDYAELKCDKNGNENTVALALMPDDINEGDLVTFELIHYVRCDKDGNIL